MVFKKPFAFIIKHFKAFHLIMLFTSIFILYNASQIRSLMVSLISSNAYMYAGASNYTGSPVVGVAFIGLLAVGMVYWLFKVRKKDLKYYRFVVLYYLGSIIGFFYMFNKLNIMATEDVVLDTLTTVRDIALIIMVTSLPVVVMSAIRGLGFNIKQFNFSKDIKDLSISDKDSEEFEIMIGQNNYKYARKIRKIIRECRYLIIENLFYITIVFAALVAIGGVTLGVKVYKNNHQVAQSVITTVNDIYYAVNATYITARDLNGNTLKEGYKYVIVNVSMQNMNSYEEKKFDSSIFSLQTGRLVYKPISYYQHKFDDLGVYIEKDTVIPTDSFLTGNIVFEIPDSMSVQHFNFRVWSGIETTSSDFMINYVNFAANGANLDEEIKDVNLELNQRINLNIVANSLFNIVVTDAKLVDSFNEKYVICEETSLKCSSRTDLVRPSSVNSSTMLELVYTGALNSDATYYAGINTMEEFIDAFTHVEYTIGTKTYKTDSTVLKKDINGKIFLVLNRDITKANSIKVVFNFRNNIYYLDVK